MAKMKVLTKAPSTPAVSRIASVSASSRAWSASSRGTTFVTLVRTNLPSPGRACKRKLMPSMFGAIESALISSPPAHDGFPNSVLTTGLPVARSGASMST